ASNSPRRKEILKSKGIKFKIKTSNCREKYSSIYDEEIIKSNSLDKALAVKEENTLVIAADTVVILDSVCLVKPQNVFEAVSMLKSLSNRTHTVITAHTFLYNDLKYTDVSKSFVTFRKISYFQILKYIIEKNPLDKAGSYGIQDFLTPINAKNPPKSSFISNLSGSYYNVMGLDIELVCKRIELFP
ncbi:MAG: Maf family protein, partial [Candidatus Gastranaerophilales bacterium]|nr:Maf family protein [Candidatus Gastranaerophilales bacterium]